MATTLSLTLDSAVVKPRVLLGTVGGTISTAESDAGNALMLLITNPFGPDVEIASCVGERSRGWLSRGRERFTIPLNGLPHRFPEDGDRCLAWLETTYLPALDGLVQLHVCDSNGREWPVENTHRLLEIRDLLTNRR